MSATVAKAQVVIDDHIREQPDLLRAVTETTQYLEDQITDVPPPAIIQWRLADATGESVQATLSDAGEPPAHSARGDYPVRWIRDPVNRKLCILKTWSKLLSKRSDSRMVRIDRLIAQLKQEIADGGEDLD